MHMQDTFKALSDPTRREIIALLKDGKRSAGDIVAHFQTTNATISHHLSILKQADLISDEKIGKYIYYELNTSVLDDMIGWFTSLRGEKNEKEKHYLLDWIYYDASNLFMVLSKASSANTNTLECTGENRQLFCQVLCIYAISYLSFRMGINSFYGQN